jgi:hypothetical protein
LDHLPAIILGELFSEGEDARCLPYQKYIEPYVMTAVRGVASAAG